MLAKNVDKFARNAIYRTKLSTLSHRVQKIMAKTGERVIFALVFIFRTAEIFHFEMQLIEI